MVRYYTGRHKFTCGVDLHARTMFLCVLDDRGYPLLEKNIKTDPELFLRAVAPFREDLVVAVECMFTWYWRHEGPDEFLGRGRADCIRSCLRATEPR